MGEREVQNDKVDRRSRRAARFLADLGDDLESGALIPTAVGGGLIVVAWFITWIAPARRPAQSWTGLEWAVVVLSIGGLTLVVVGIVLALRFAYCRSRRDGRGRIESIGVSLKHLARFAFRWLP